MVSTIRVAFARVTEPHKGIWNRKLRQAGYLDGERQPRHQRHWANR